MSIIVAAWTLVVILLLCYNFSSFMCDYLDNHLFSLQVTETLSVGGCWSTTRPVQGVARGREPPQSHHTQRRLSVSASMHRVEELWR